MRRPPLVLLLPPPLLLLLLLLLRLCLLLGGLRYRLVELTVASVCGSRVGPTQMAPKPPEVATDLWRRPA